MTQLIAGYRELAGVAQAQADTSTGMDRLRLKGLADSLKATANQLERGV